MLKNFLLISIRNIITNKGGAYINLLGLTLGMAACISIFSHLYFEMSYDQFKNSDHIFRLETHTYDAGILTGRSAYTTLQTGSDLDLPSFTRLMPFSEEGSGLFRYEKAKGEVQKIHMDRIYFGEPSFFEIFPVSLIFGDEESVLSAPNSIVLSESTAKKIFGSEWMEKDLVLGRMIKSSGTGVLTSEYMVTGVFQDRPTNTHLKFDAMISLNSTQAGLDNPEVLIAENTYTYVLRDDPTLSQQIEIKTSDKELFFRPIEEIYLTPDVSHEPEPEANAALLLFLAVIGCVILLLACTNYINNTIVNSIYRAKEIGVRKVLGAQPRQLLLNFIGESLLINILAAVLAIFLFKVGTTLAVQWIETDFALNSTIPFETVGSFLIILMFASTALSSFYPAIFLSSMDPISSLRGKVNIMGSQQFGGVGKIIKPLIIFQLCTSIVFLSAVYVIHKQLAHLEENDSHPFQLQIGGIFPGTSSASSDFTNQAMGYISQLAADGWLEDIRFSNLNKGTIKTGQSVELLLSEDPHFDPERNIFHLLVVDFSFWQKKDEAFAAGGNFSPGFGRDATGVIINESALEALGLDHPDSAINEHLRTKGGDLRVIGVTRNTRDSDPPTVYVTGFRYLTYLDLTLEYPGRAGENVSQFITQVEHLLAARLPFLYLFDRGYEQQRDTENAMSNLFLFFSWLAILISSMGMHGLSSFITQKRSKELGIRKILGASSGTILIVLFYDFMKLILYASTLSIPIVYIGTKIWLENYVYRISIDPTLIGVPILAISGICLVVIAEKCWKTATLSPVKSLDSH